MAPLDELWDRTRLELQNSPFQLSPGAEAELQALVAEAASRMEREGRTEQGDIDKAASVITALIDHAAGIEVRRLALSKGKSGWTSN